MSAATHLMAGDSDRLAAWQDRTMDALVNRVTNIEIWQSTHDKLCGFRWKVLMRVAVLGFIWLTVLIVGLRTPFIDALLKTLP
jgi:hypothetical protein